MAEALMKILPEGWDTSRAKAYFDRIGRAGEAARTNATETLRTPHYCSGCPHNSSTVVPEGSRALAGIGCHYMANFMPDRKTDMTSQMGGEGISLGRPALGDGRTARLRQSRRRHLLPFRQPCHPRRGHLRREHDLQDSV